MDSHTTLNPEWAKQVKAIFSLKEPDAIKQACLTQGISLNSEDEQGNTALHVAAECNYEAIVTLLLKTNIDINKQNHAGYTPLHLAIRHNNFLIVAALLKKGADPKIRINLPTLKYPSEGSCWDTALFHSSRTLICFFERYSNLEEGIDLLNTKLVNVSLDIGDEEQGDLNPLPPNKLETLAFLMVYVYSQTRQENLQRANYLLCLRKGMSETQARADWFGSLGFVLGEDRELLEELVTYFLSRNQLISKLKALFFTQEEKFNKNRQLFLEYCARHDITPFYDKGKIFALNENRIAAGKAPLPYEVIQLIFEAMYPDTKISFESIPTIDLYPEKAKHAAHDILFYKTFNFDTQSKYKTIYEDIRNTNRKIAKNLVGSITDKRFYSDMRLEPYEDEITRPYNNPR